VAGGNVTTTEAALATATQSFGGPYTLFWDLSLVSGTYTLTTVGNLALAPNGFWTDFGLGYALIFANGTTLPSAPDLGGALNIEVTQAASVATVSSGRVQWSLFELANTQESGSSGAFFEVTGNANAFVFLHDSSALGGPNSLQVNGISAFATVQCQDASSLGVNAVESVASGQIQIDAAGAGVSVDPSLYEFLQVENIYVDLSGTGVSTINATVQNVGAILISNGQIYEATAGGWITIAPPYAPAVPTNWAGSPPTTVTDALDRIAANTSNAHPIP
jgi:hypothetical protein